MHNLEPTSVAPPALAQAGLDGHQRESDPRARKQELLREGGLFRANIALGQSQLRQSVRPDAMLHAVMGKAGLALRSGANAVLAPGSAKLSAWMPYAMGALRLVRRGKIGKRTLALGVVAAAGVWFLNHHRKAEVLQEHVSNEG